MKLSEAISWLEDIMSDYGDELNDDYRLEALQMAINVMGWLKRTREKEG